MSIQIQSSKCVDELRRGFLKLLQKLLMLCRGTMGYCGCLFSDACHWFVVMLVSNAECVAVRRVADPPHAALVTDL